MILMTRRVAFSAAHANWLTDLSRAENQARFGPDASPEPYGHNYLLDVGVSGPIDPKTGILVNIKVIDILVRQHVLQVLDRRFLNQSVPEFFHRPVTPENLVLFIRDVLTPHLPQEVTLSRLRLEPAPGWFVQWHAFWNAPHEESPAMLVTRCYEFSASHRLHSSHLSAEENKELFGKCNRENGHGHNYEFEVTVSGPINAISGRVVDTDLLDEIVSREVADRWDHRHLNYDVPEFQGLVPSAEVITKVIWERLVAHIPAPARLHRVLVRETARNLFEYSGEEETIQ